MPVLILLAWLFPLHVQAVDWVGKTLEGAVCKGDSQGFGPYDFYEVNDPGDPLYTEGRWWEVRTVHYAPGMMHLSADPFGQIDYMKAAAEFDYILRAYPNHPDALRALTELEFKKRRVDRGRSVPLSSRFPPPECYFQRAISFRPKAAYLYSYYGTYLHRLGRYDLALENYRYAVELNPDNAEAHYNLGLCYIELDELSKAREHADKAYELGFPLPGLRRKLERLEKESR